MKLLQKISYFGCIYQWSACLDFYAAWLRQIELGRKSWSDDPQNLESVILSGHNLPRQLRQTNFRTISKNQNSKEQIWFCVKYQRNKCEQQTSPHSTIIRGISRTVYHICASCWQKEQVQKSHPECSDQCPNKNKK